MVGYDAWSVPVEMHDEHCGCGLCMAAIDDEVAVSLHKHTDALIDIAYDCASLEAAQKRAKEALKENA